MVSEYLYAKWQAILLPCPVEKASALYADLEKCYTERGRHYHNLDHLTAMFRLYDEFGMHLNDPDVVALAIFFHDAIYKASRKDNEEVSAGYAGKKLSKTGWAKEKIEQVRTFILATKTHETTGNPSPDLAFLLDFDLAILGAPNEEYQAYSQKIRQEYRIYPDLLYRPGRRKALSHFLERPFIFQTALFREKFEQQARENLTREIEMLV